MGIQISSQQIEKLKTQRIDLYYLQQLTKSIKSTQDIETAIKQYLKIMTIKQKIGQLQQISYGDQVISPQMQKQIADGGVGSILNVWKLQVVNQMQKIAMEQQRLKIPLLIGKDVIHGFRTVFPIPLAQAASFNPSLVQQGSRYAAIQCSSIGIRWTFTPMVDIARDPRWGRIAQGFGQDPYLASIMGSAAVKGFQSKILTDPTAVAACGKHYVGYGATQGGRDYNTTLIPQNTLRDIYLAPFQALCSAGILTYMSAFNDLNGQPSTANQFTLKKVLRNEWAFKGLVVSDYTAVSQLIVHGFAQNQMDAARRSFLSGLDMQMVSTCYYDHLQTLLQKKVITMEDLDYKVGNVLRVKFKLDLFNTYNTDPSRQDIILDPKHKEAAKLQATQCPVLLQNNKNTLPISKNIKNLAVIGALADDPDNQIGCWAPDGKAQDSITPLTTIKQKLKDTNIIFSQGYKSARDTDTSLINDAIQAASGADAVLLFVGEDNNMSGQSNARAYLNLPGIQETLISQISKTGKPIVLVIYAGRSLTLQKIVPLVDSVLYAWHLGTMAGPALFDIIFGNVCPTGKLPITFPRTIGQIPLYYNKKNTGRPNDSHQYKPFTSSYIDTDSTPLYYFGFGLSYNTYTYSDLKLSKYTLQYNDTVTISLNVKNQGKYTSDQTVFLFVRDLVGSYTRPVKELKDFERVNLKPGQQKMVVFLLPTSKLKFWTRDLIYKVQAGKFKLWVGRDSDDTKLQASFQVLGNQDKQFEQL